MSNILPYAAGSFRVPCYQYHWQLTAYRQKRFRQTESLIFCFYIIKDITQHPCFLSFKFFFCLFLFFVFAVIFLDDNVDNGQQALGL